MNEIEYLIDLCKQSIDNAVDAEDRARWERFLIYWNKVLEQYRESKPYVPPVLSEAKCPECTGTGKVALFNLDYPCSRGCVPPTAPLEEEE
jgi:hypothetical protein